MHRELHAEPRHRADDWQSQESPQRDLPLAVSTRQIHHGKSVWGRPDILNVHQGLWWFCNPFNFFNVIYSHHHHSKNIHWKSLCGILYSFTCFGKNICYIGLCNWKWLNAVSIMDVIFPYLHGFPSFPTHATHSKHIPNFVTRIVYKSVVSKREGFENG